MEYIYAKSPDIVIDRIVTSLSEHLAMGERVAWLLSGGSAIALEVRVAQALQTHNTSNLTIGLIDERYGELGHKDENYSQLVDAGLPLTISRVLTGDTPEITTKAFGTFIDEALNKADFSLGIFGIGSDGHTAGIKPHSPAVSNLETAVFYEWDDYRRITITAPTIQKIDEVIVFAIGSEKAATLNMLLHTDTPIVDQPAQILKSVKDCQLYTDQEL